MATVTYSANWDEVDVLFTLSPNGDLDEAPTWINTGIGSLEVEEPGHLRAILRLTGPGAAVTLASAPADNPGTPDTVETVTDTFEGAISHSKATALGGAVTAISKGAGFP